MDNTINLNDAALDDPWAIPNLLMLGGGALKGGQLGINAIKNFQRAKTLSELAEKKKVWGIPFRKASGDPEKAIKTLSEYKKGFVPNADNNGVDFVWGEYIPPTKQGKKGGGYGLAHIEGRRFEDGENGSDFLNIIPDLMKNGKKFYKEFHPGRYYKELENTEAAIRTDYNGKPWHWLNSAYFKNK